MPSDQRFVKTYSQAGFFGAVEIWVDRLTGVKYLFRKDGYGGGLTLLPRRFILVSL